MNSGEKRYETENKRSNGRHNLTILLKILKANGTQIEDIVKNI